MCQLISTLKEFPFITSFEGVTRLIQEDSSGVPRMIVSRSKCASWVCKGCIKSVFESWYKRKDQSFEGVLRVFQWCRFVSVLFLQ